MSADGFRTFQTDIQQKIRQLLGEFVNGDISNEQFNLLYERYDKQLEMALGINEDNQSSTDDITTIALKASTIGKAIGLLIYHYRSQSMIEKLGQVDLSHEILTDKVKHIQQIRKIGNMPATSVEKITSNQWLICMSKQYTTALVIFKNEPAPQQVRQLERLLGDFEIANGSFLKHATIDQAQLAKPFIGFIRQKLDT